MKVFIINGRGGSGKDTFIEYFSEQAGKNFVLNISTIDYIKEIAKELGWNGEKDNLSRKYLSNLKEMAVFWADLPCKKMVKQTTEFFNELQSYGVEKRGFVFIHCREPKEIQHLIQEIPYPTYSLLIRRRSITDLGNSSDDDVENYSYDFVIENNYGLDNLCQEAIKFYNKNI